MNIEEKYSKNFQEFFERFSTKNFCHPRQYLIDIRLAEGYFCRHYGSRKYRLTAKNKIHCFDCKKEFSITSEARQGKVLVKHMKIL
jgi:hypothetical protein